VDQLNRERSWQIVKKYITDKNLRKHSLSTEAVMIRLAEHFGEDTKIWGLAGLMHDIDYNETKDLPKVHSLKGSEILAELGYPEEVVYAVKVHNDCHGLPRKSLLDKALYAADPLTGLIVAGALIRSEKKLAAVDVPFLQKRFKEKGFARGANRQQIMACSEMGLTLEEFLTLGLEGMQRIAAELEL
jgi:putative nucleotidyltransferase with HDIG domain